ncbi:hypothetical protein Kpol_1052p25 [Vanderwaltozyma polyspora DSM 70294]|uniref:Obg-like ATPase homolog n=1 Tax=Vanderwaltozyma polyspora (strain ATCC 22028 / DSM 70294 / BCRC 21397 / CBS 2163 / NBRC 10782 / NRRL Y-8283 / UCD 57-17) TaxID=436907 RepID=A7TM36_VANPO|nr:uncharacterized protein Kpol_1052p25 [Vanderwaltozyma polyspora DSM 70294]EDO16678.1 hypothetical protein Kpol_1052p25 [Vanderwaltozyma polyspora DSM 70294]
MLGRNTTNLKAGIVGLANIGKSTLFQAITNSKLGNPANYPFATIDPLDYRIPIQNEKLDYLKEFYQSERIIHAPLTLYDIAGLTRGASSGQGLGNKFLNDIRNIDSILHVVRGFKDDEIIHLEKTVDPIRDLELVNDELILKDLEFLENATERLNKKLKNRLGPKEDGQLLQREVNFLNELQDHLYNGKKIIHYKQNWTTDEISILNTYNFLTAKPTLVLLNVNPHEYILSQVDKDKTPVIKEVKDWLTENSPGDDLLPFSGHFETKHNLLKDDQKEFQNYCSDIINNELGGITDVPIDPMLIGSIVPSIIKKTKNLLSLISFYTCGDIEVREWVIRNGTTAAEAAGVIHTDLQKTFINAEVINYNSLIESGSKNIKESNLKSKGLIKRVGKKHIMEDNDIVLFKSTASKK